MIKGFERFLEKQGIETKKEINLGLDRIQQFLGYLGNPERELKAVHIAGTNGKGSTLQFLRHILIEAGYTVGIFTSPYILNVNDQISTNTGPLSDDEFEEVLKYTHALAGNQIEELTEFELLTVLSIVYFSRINQQDIVIFETGMGGLTDSTNVLTPILTIITNISLEHTQFLGDTIEKIAYQKAGIIKSGIPCVTGVKGPDALDVIKQYAKEQQAPLSILYEDFFVSEQLEIGLKGNHQKENSALAIKAAQLLQENGCLKIDDDHIENGVKNTFWPGRFEVISKQPLVILDGAHNPDAMERLLETIKPEYPNQPYHFIIGALNDKNTKLMIEMVEQVADQITFVDFSFPRAASAESLMEQCTIVKKEAWKELKMGLSQVLNSQHSNKVTIITGSLYLLAEVKFVLQEMNLS